MGKSSFSWVIKISNSVRIAIAGFKEFAVPLAAGGEIKTEKRHRAFQLHSPKGRFFYRVAMSVYVFITLSVPF